MSFAALALVLRHIAMVGLARQADEGTEAHLWQLLMAGQIPVIAFFAIKWLPRSPLQTLLVLVLQAVARLAAAAPVSSRSGSGGPTIALWRAWPRAMTPRWRSEHTAPSRPAGLTSSPRGGPIGNHSHGGGYRALAAYADGAASLHVGLANHP